jgi:hypothetical protein
MTRLPLESRDVKGTSGPDYNLNHVCAVPGCTELATERHHLFRRSFLIGDYAWVQLPSGEQVGNYVRLCHNHHHAVTVNAAQITWDNGVFVWAPLMGVPRPLQWQPPIEVNGDGVQVQVETIEEPQAVDDGICPTCHRPLARHHTPHEEKRPRRTWSITVPKDERENGAETLDTLLEAARDEMGKAGLPYGDQEAVRFFVLAQALGLFVQHAEEVLS